MTWKLSDATLIGKVSFLSAKAGGRETPVGYGYRGQFFYDGMDCDAIHMYDFQGAVPFDQEVTTYIYLPNPDHRFRIRDGRIFLVREGPHTIGYGQVTHVFPLKAENGE